MENLRGLATGLGSLPHQDAQDALDLIFRYTPKIPFWPQLPQRDKREGMTEQFSQGLPLNNQADLESFYEKLLSGDAEYFKISQDHASGLYAFRRRLEKDGCAGIEYIKMQVTGPFTLSAAFNNKEGIALLYDKILKQAVFKGLNFKARWQIESFRPFGKKMVLFIDEPYLACLGSGYTPLSREDAASGLAEFTEGLKAEDVFLGVHCCGNTDWSILTDNRNIDIISFDAFGYLDKFVLYAENIKGFLSRGGAICWGIVPTQEFTGEESVESLSCKIRRGMDILSKKGIGEGLIKSGMLISPSCGLGTFAPSKAEKILRLLSQVSDFIREKL